MPQPASGRGRGRRQAYAAAAELPSVLPRHVRPCGELRAWAAPPGGVTLYKYLTTLNKFNGINHYCSFILFARCLVICISCYKIDWNPNNATYIRHCYIYHCFLPRTRQEVTNLFKISIVLLRNIKARITIVKQNSSSCWYCDVNIQLRFKILYIQFCIYNNNKKLFPGNV